MKPTRRTFLEVIGAAAAAEMISSPVGMSATAAAASVPTVARSVQGEKCLFWVAAATPCDKNLKFEEDLYKDMLAYFKANGADGVVVLGTTGEYPSFSMAERKNVPETIELSQHAAANGADGLLIIPPFYYKKPSLEGLTKYYSLVFDQVKIPINLYHIPGTSGVPISLELLHSLAKYPNLAGIKDSNGDRS